MLSSFNSYSIAHLFTSLRWTVYHFSEAKALWTRICFLTAHPYALPVKILFTLFDPKIENKSFFRKSGSLLWLILIAFIYKNWLKVTIQLLCLFLVISQLQPEEKCILCHCWMVVHWQMGDTLLQNGRTLLVRCYFHETISPGMSKKSIHFPFSHIISVTDDSMLRAISMSPTEIFWSHFSFTFLQLLDYWTICWCTYR